MYRHSLFQKFYTASIFEAPGGFYYGAGINVFLFIRCTFIYFEVFKIPMYNIPNQKDCLHRSSDTVLCENCWKNTFCTLLPSIIIVWLINFFPFSYYQPMKSTCVEWRGSFWFLVRIAWDKSWHFCLPIFDKILIWKFSFWDSRISINRNDLLLILPRHGTHFSSLCKTEISFVITTQYWLIFRLF